MPSTSLCHRSHDMTKQNEMLHPESLKALVLYWMWALWQVFIIAPLISLCLREGDIVLSICNILTATCMAADQSPAIWRDISRSFIFSTFVGYCGYFFLSKSKIYCSILLETSKNKTSQALSWCGLQPWRKCLVCRTSPYISYTVYTKCLHAGQCR